MQSAPLGQSEKGGHKLQSVPKDCSEALDAYLEQELVYRPIMLRVKSYVVRSSSYILLVLGVFVVEIRQTFVWK